MSRGLVDRLTNRDVVREQKINILYMTKDLKEKNDLVNVQAEAIDEFKVEMVKLTDEISSLWESVNAKTRTKPVKEDESEKNKQ